MALWEPKGCCLCFSLRTGCLILCSLMLIGSALSLLGMVGALVQHDEEMNSRIKELCSDRLPHQTECQHHTKKIVVGVTVLRVVVDIVKFIFSILMIVGINKSKTRLMIPLMVLVLSEVVLSLVAGVVVMVMLATVASGGVVVAVAVVISVVVFLETYFLLVFRSYYLEVTKETEDSERLLLTQEDSDDKMAEE